jgi:hypothetical protein
LLVLAATLSSTGCAALIAVSGCEPQSLTEQLVTEEFGAPPAAPDADGSSVTFRTHRKIANYKQMYAMGDVITFGLGEVVWFPLEVYNVTRATMFGQEVTVRYDAAGRVTRVIVDGKPVY